MNRINAPSDVIVAWNRCINYDEENFVFHALNEDNDAVTVIFITQGDKESVEVQVDVSVEFLCKIGVKAIIISHNHVSGCLTSSNEDIELTRAIVKKCRKVGIKVRDYIILTSDGKYISLKEEGFY